VEVDNNRESITVIYRYVTHPLTLSHLTDYIRWILSVHSWCQTV